VTVSDLFVLDTCFIVGLAKENVGVDLILLVRNVRHFTLLGKNRIRMFSFNSFNWKSNSTLLSFTLLLNSFTLILTLFVARVRKTKTFFSSTNEIDVSF
jgi:hypothetical protein